MAMTAAKWLKETDPEALLAYLMERQPSERKLRLFAVACSRRIAGASREVATVAERHADGLVTAEALAAFPHPSGRDYKWIVAEPRAADAALAFARGLGGPPWNESLQALLLRDLFGNPFHLRRLRLDPGWLTPAVVPLATAAYQKRLKWNLNLDPVRLAILADALEEAGCADEAILSHLRSAGPHIRGCWALDLVLGKG